MLEWLFGFRGAIGRVRYLAGIALLGFGAAAVFGLVVAGGFLIRGAGKTWVGPTILGLLLLTLLVLPAWSIVALSTRRLRDMGVPPILALGGLAALGVTEPLWGQPIATAPWADAVHRPITTMVAAAVFLTLLVWPGRAPEGGVREGGWGFLAPVAAVVGGLALVLGAGLAFDPLQRASCPVVGAGAPSDDCASHGVTGRLVAGYLVVRANHKLDRHEAASALADLDRAIAVRPAFVYAFNSRGLAHEQLNNQAQALRAYDQALALQPAYVHGLLNRAVLLDKLGHRDRALADLRTILRVEPANAVARQGVAYMTGGR